MTDVSVIIACYNSATTIRETLEAIVAQEWDRPWEIILADNGSTDATVAIFHEVAAEHPGRAMRSIDASAEKGKAFAMNLVVPQAAGRAIIMADSDDVVAPGWLAAMGGALDSAEIVGAASDYRRLNTDWVLEYRMPDPASRDRIQERYVTGYQPGLPFVSGHCMGFTRALFDVLGGFDTSYTVADDIDFSFRAQLAGHEIVMVPAAVVHYRYRDTIASIRRQAFFYAKDQVKLCQRFPELALPMRRRWRAFLYRSRKLGRHSAGHVWRREMSDRVVRAKMAWEWGWQQGTVAGMIAFRAPPP